MATTLKRNPNQSAISGMAAPLVSIIMPAHNAETTIAESMGAALDQTHREIELIVIDDGSTDRTCDIVRQFDDFRVVLLENEHRGVSFARNSGLYQARGDYIKYLDSDDLLNNAAVERQIVKLSSEKRLALCTSAWGRFSDSISDLRIVEASDWQDLDPLTFLELSLGGGGTMPVMTWLIPRDLAQLTGPWRVGAPLYEDTEYGSRLALNAETVVFCRDAWGYYRSNRHGTLSNARDRATYEAGWLCVEAICDMLIANQDSPRCRRILANFCRRYTIQAMGIDAALTRRSEQLVAHYGGSDLEPSGGALARYLGRIIGWQYTLRLKRLLQR